MSTRRWWVVLGVGVGLLVLIIWALLPWEWSMIDDPGYVTALRQLSDEYGVPSAVIRHIAHMATSDQTWGLFRPSFWVYSSTAYLLPISVLHAVRLGMLGLAIAGPLVAMHRRGASRTTITMGALIMGAACAPLMDGLFQLSLMELSGAALVGISLMLRSDSVRLIPLTLAAWFKSPYSWVLLGDSIRLWRSRRRGLAGAYAAIGLVTLVIAAMWARNGGYTNRFHLDYATAWRMATNVPKLLEFGTGALFVALVWWILISGARLAPTLLTGTFAVAWAGYTLQLLPWSVTGYYLGGINFLLGVLLTTVLANPAGLGRRRTAAALLLPAVTCAYLFWGALDRGMSTNETLKELRTCLSSQPRSSTALSQNLGPEAVVRLEQNILLSSPSWSGEVRSADDPASPTLAPLLYVDYLNTGSAPAGYSAVLCKVKDATVYQMVTP